MEKEEKQIEFNWLAAEIRSCEALDVEAIEIMLEAARSAFTDDLGELTEIYNHLKELAEVRRAGRLNPFAEDRVDQTNWDGQTPEAARKRDNR